MDLTTRPPRSPRVRIGGYVLLARMLDKARAVITGTNGEYHYNCPLDQQFINFLGINPDALLVQIKSGKGDAELLTWIESNASHKLTPWEIQAWNSYQEMRTPSDVDTRDYFNGMHKSAGESRTDIVSWFDVLDLDDFTSFGGKA